MSGVIVIMVMTTMAYQDRPATMPEDYWRNPLRCGLNCLYGYMSLHGREQEFGTLARRVNLGTKGANLDDLRQVATELGVSSSIVKTNNRELDQMPLPAIAHFDVRGGHYQLLLQVDSDFVAVADMSSGTIEDLPRDVFLEMWSGYLLVPGSVTLWKDFVWQVILSALIGFSVFRCCRIYFRGSASR